MKGHIRTLLGLWTGLCMSGQAMASPEDKLQIKQELRSLRGEMLELLARDSRSIDGYGNNVSQPEWGSAGTTLLRLSPQSYADGASAPSGGGRPNPRDISNSVLAQSGLVFNEKGVSDLVWQWGQFIDHDLDLTPVVEPLEVMNIPVPLGDPWFDPYETGQAVIGFERSLYRMVEGVREQININTAYMDASQVYGSDLPRALALRTLDGTGRLKTSDKDYLPYNEGGLFNLPDDHDPSFFLAGDVRANEQVGLTSMHTVFVREHNFWADLIRDALPEANGDQVYELARRMVGAELQCVTYREFLPVVLGPDALPPYLGYHPDVNPGIATEFSTAAYRVGHTLLSPVLQRLKRNDQPMQEGGLPLRFAFFTPTTFLEGDGPAPLLRGLAAQTAQNVDVFIIDDVRNFLFGPPGSGGFDLGSLNIQRGRDHGIGSYNEVRAALGLSPRAGFAEVSSWPFVRDRLASVYPSVDQVDLWVGCLAEDHHGDAQVGETMFHILRNQFLRLRDGDRFYYEHDLPPGLKHLVECQTLSGILCRNSKLGNEFPTRPFHSPFPP